jgi:hypothetical protein
MRGAILPLPRTPSWRGVTIYCYVGLVLNSRIQNHFSNLLNVVNVIRFWFTLNILLLATFAVMEIFMSGYMRQDRYDKAVRVGTMGLVQVENRYVSKIKYSKVK